LPGLGDKCFKLSPQAAILLFQLGWHCGGTPCAHGHGVSGIMYRDFSRLRLMQFAFLHLSGRGWENRRTLLAALGW
ncbi:MAG TPA: hypothetical protein VIQ22_05915, partial [Gammaproteobacteria bacterium]